MRKGQLATLILVAGALVVAAAGCGSSSIAKTVSSAGGTARATTSPAPTHLVSTTPLTRAQLIKQADAVCTRVNAKTNANPYRTTEDVVRLAPLLATYEQAANAELARLTPPAVLATDWYTILAALRERASDTAQLGADAKSGEVGASRSILDAAAPTQRKALTIAKRDGFMSCAELG